MNVVINTRYGQDKTVAQVYSHFIEGITNKGAVYEKLHHVPHVSLQLVLHGVTVLRNTKHPLALTADSTVNTLRYDLRGHRRLLERELAGGRWTIGCADSIAPLDVMGRIVNEAKRLNRTTANHYDAKGLMELATLFIALGRGLHYLVMQHNHAATGLPLSCLWLAQSMEDAEALIPIVTMAQQENSTRRAA